MTEFYKSYGIVNGKFRRIVVNDEGEIINKNPTEKELKGLNNELYKIKHRSKYYTDEDLLEYPRQFYKEHGFPPSATDFYIDSNYPSIITYQKRFGSWSNALKLADLDKFPKKPRSRFYTDNGLLYYLSQFEKDNGRSPAARDFNNNQKYPDCATYQRRFGSWTNALKLVGLDVDSIVRKGIVKTNDQKARLAEIRVIEHFIESPTDLSGENKTSQYDGVCPSGKTYDVKSSKLYKGKYYSFCTDNEYKEEIEIYYLLGFNEDYSQLEYGWRIPGDIADSGSFRIAKKISSRGSRDVENMKEYEITDILLRLFPR